jgi:hypothetical protein
LGAAFLAVVFLAAALLGTAFLAAGFFALAFVGVAFFFAAVLAVLLSAATSVFAVFLAAVFPGTTFFFASFLALVFLAAAPVFAVFLAALLGTAFFATGLVPTFALVFLDGVRFPAAFFLADAFSLVGALRFARLADLDGVDTSYEDASSMSMSMPNTDDKSSDLSARPLRGLLPLGA